ncbi:alpha-galactosidase [Streptomyces mirabilis]|nr:alpha-galactosidase [Streptomyces mirabilis]
MRFGLWVEPEMVNPDSDLYREHPDWVLHFPGRPRSELRNQLVLNFARRDVADWAHDWLTRLVGDHGIDFLKWDMNRAFSEAGWPDRQDGTDRLGPAYVRNLYGVLDRLRADHPALRIETCSGGGGRVDLGILSRTDQAWASDNTDAADRMGIQQGYGQIYPARTMGAWVTDVPNQLTGRTVPLRFRFHVAMAGALGIGGDLTHWSEEELREGADLVATYKKVRHLVQHGSLDRLSPPAEDSVCVVQYTAADASETCCSPTGVSPPRRAEAAGPAARSDPGAAIATRHRRRAPLHGARRVRYRPRAAGGRLVQHGGAPRPGGLTPRQCAGGPPPVALARRGPVSTAGPSPGPGSAGVGWAVC